MATELLEETILTQNIDLRIDNPFAYGEILVFDDGSKELQTEPFTFDKSDKDAYYNIMEGDTLSTIAGIRYGSSKWWWILYYANLSIIDNPFELALGLEILIPDLNLAISKNL